jgi:hypothetical protein
MSRISVVTGDEAGVGGGVKSMKNLGFCKPTKWSSNVRTKDNWLVMHNVEFEMNCLTPDSLGNTVGKLIYVKCTAAAAITPAGEIVVEKSKEEGGSKDSGGRDSGSGDEGSSAGSDGSGSRDDPTGKKSEAGASEQDLSAEDKKELEDLKRQQEELEKEIDQLKDLAIEAGKALDPTPASDLYDMITALQAGEIGAAVLAAGFVLLSLSPWKLLKMGRGAIKLAKIMKKLSKLYDKLKALKKRIAEFLKNAAAKAKKTIRISKRAAKQIEKVTVRTNRKGQKAIQIKYKDGSVKDISSDRVKEWVPNSHPNAPSGAMQKVRFPESIPGSKGAKRLPTPEELEILNGF